MRKKWIHKRKLNGMLEFKYKLPFIFQSLLQELGELNTILKCNFYACEPSIAAYVLIVLEKTYQPSYGLQHNQSLSHRDI